MRKGSPTLAKPPWPGRAPGDGELGQGEEGEERLRCPDPQMPEVVAAALASLPAAAALATAAAGSSCAQLVPGGGTGARLCLGPGGQGAGRSRPRGGAAGIGVLGGGR